MTTPDDEYSAYFVPTTYIGVCGGLGFRRSAELERHVVAVAHKVTPIHYCVCGNIANFCN